MRKLLKSYRLSYSYEGTDAGQTTDALIDMTGNWFRTQTHRCRSVGGIEESFNTQEIKDKEQFWQTMGTALKHDAMVGCSIAVRSSSLICRRHSRIGSLARSERPWSENVQWFSQRSCLRCHSGCSSEINHGRNSSNRPLSKSMGKRSRMDRRVEWRVRNLGDLCLVYPIEFRDVNNWNKVDPHTREQLRYQRLADGEFWWVDRTSSRRWWTKRILPVGCSMQIGWRTSNKYKSVISLPIPSKVNWQLNRYVFYSSKRCFLFLMEWFV